MSSVIETQDTHDEVHEDAHGGHPSDLGYIKIAALLAVLTLIEVLTYTFDMEGGALMAVVFPIMIVKFVIVAGYFMHLKFDTKMFSVLFVSGLAFAVAVYCVMLTMFRFW